MNQPRCLIIVEGSGAAPPDIDWKMLLQDGATCRAATLLWMVDAPPDALVALLEKQQITVTVADTAALLQAQMQTFSEELRQWLHAVTARLHDIPDLWLSRITEPNFSSTPWFDLVRFNVCEQELSTGNYADCRAVCSRELHLLIERLCAARCIPFRGMPAGDEAAAGRGALFTLRSWFRNLRADCAAWMATRRAGPVSPCDTLVYARFPSNWSRDGHSAFYRYTGFLSRPLGKAGRTGAYLVTAARRNAPTLKGARRAAADCRALGHLSADMPVMAAEGFGRLQDIVKTYFGLKGAWRLLSAWKRAAAAGKITWRGIDVHELFSGCVATAAFCDWPAARYHERCIVRALQATGARSLVVPIFELVEGRAVVRAGKQAGVTTVGIQHGAAGRAHRWRIMLPAGLMAAAAGPGGQCTPDTIAVEGIHPAGWLAECGYPESRITIIGAPRLAQGLPPAPGTQPQPHIIVLGDMHRPEPLFRWALTGMSDTAFSLILRPHPSRYARTCAWLGSQPPALQKGARVSRQHLSLADELQSEQPVCFFAGCTGAAVDAALAGWPVIVILSRWLPDYSPLTGIDNGHLFSSGDPLQVRAWVERLYRDPSFRLGYIRQCLQAAERLVAATGEEAARRLAALV